MGKTSLIARYIHNEFPYRSQSLTNSNGMTVYPTVIDANDCTLIFIELSTISDIQRLKISDTIPTACLIVFSITDENSFLKLNTFYESIRNLHVNESASIPTLFLANKIDREQDRRVNQQAVDRIKTNGFDLFEISVKGNVGIGDAIYTAIKYLQYEQNYHLEKVKPKNICACIIT